MRILVPLVVMVLTSCFSPPDRTFDVVPEPAAYPDSVVAVSPQPARHPECSSAFDCHTAPSHCLDPACLGGQCAFVPSNDGATCMTDGDAEGTCAGGVCEVNILAVCNPYQACDLQGPCSCPNGFLCAAGLCVRDDDPWTECYNTNDCITTSPPYANTCWRPICYFYTDDSGDPASGCGWEPEPAGTSCKKQNGQDGQCGSGDTAAMCV